MTTCVGTGASRTAHVSATATPGGTVTVGISGTVVATVCDTVVLSPSTLAFGDHGVGTTSPAQTVMLTNPGSQPYGPLTGSLGGTNANQFAITADSCTGVTLSPGGACSIDVVFKPTSHGVKNGLVTVAAPKWRLASTRGLQIKPTYPQLEDNPNPFRSSQNMDKIIGIDPRLWTTTM